MKPHKEKRRFVRTLCISLCCWSGHGHSFDHFIDEMCYIDKKRGNWIRYHATFCQTAHFMDYFKSYGAGKKYNPTPMGAAEITLHARDAGNHCVKKVSVDLFN